MGRVIAAFGIKGWVKVKAFTETPDGLADYPVWWLENLAGKPGWTPIRVEDTVLHDKGFSALLEGCVDRTAAERLHGVNVGLPRAELPVLEGEIYWIDLIGMAVVNPKGEHLGRIESLMETGANDVLVVKPDGEVPARLIPFIPQVVHDVDRDGRKVTVDWELDY